MCLLLVNLLELPSTAPQLCLLDKSTLPRQGTNTSEKGCKLRIRDRKTFAETLIPGRDDVENSFDSCFTIFPCCLLLLQFNFLLLPSCCKLQVFISNSQLTIYAVFSLQWTANVIMPCKRTQYNVDTSYTYNSIFLCPWEIVSTVIY